MDFLKQKGPLAREFCNTLIYIISLVSLKPASLQSVLTELQWNGMWFFSLAFFAVIFMEMLSDFLLVTDRCTAWKALNGNVSEAEFHNLQQIVLCENQKVSILLDLILMCGHSNQCRQAGGGIERFCLSESRCTVSARILHGFKPCRGDFSVQNPTKDAEITG